MAFLMRKQLKGSSGFILPLSLAVLLTLSMICFMSLDRFALNQTGLKEEKQITDSFLSFQSAKNDLIYRLNTGAPLATEGHLSEDQRTVTYTIQTLSSYRLQVTLKQLTQSNSTLVSWFVYNEDTKKMEKWVTQ